MRQCKPARLVRALVPTAALALSSALLAPMASARPVMAEIALIFDVSDSVSQAEYNRQREGWANALGSHEFATALNEVSSAVTSSDDPFGVAAGVYLYAGNVVQARPWTWLPNGSAASILRAQLLDLRRPEGTAAALGGGSLAYATNIAEGLDRARAGLQDNAFVARRGVLALSGDGEQNTSRAGNAGCSTDCTRQVEAARDDAIALGLMISALAMTNDDPHLDVYMAQHVVSADGLTRDWNTAPKPFLDVLMHAVAVAPVDSTAVPEPGTLALAALALLAARGARVQRPGWRCGEPTGAHRPCSPGRMG